MKLFVPKANFLKNSNKFDSVEISHSNSLWKQYTWRTLPKRSVISNYQSLSNNNNNNNNNNSV